MNFQNVVFEFHRRAPTGLLWLLPGGLALGAALALVSPGAFFPGWLAFSLLAILSLLALTASQRLVGGGKTLGWILALAFALRLGLGVGASILEPRIGYDNPVNKAGYLFTDAFVRDNQAWDLATSSNPLMTAFNEKLVSDQYGGLLWVSALTYRYLSPDAHRPLLVTLLAALFGAFGAAFVWGAGKRISTEKLAQVSALVFAFFPEAILQGAAQMREPFLMTFIAMAFYGLVEFRSQTSEVLKTSEVYYGWIWIVLALIGMFLVSPGFILVTLIAAAGWLYFSQGGRRVPWQAVLAALAVFALAFIALSLSWNSLVAVKSGGPLGVIGDWARETVKWNQQLLEGGSGIVQLLFKNFPSSLKLPFIAIYGILQPVLPAAIFEQPSTPFWRILGIIRALGWYTMLPLLAYAPFSLHSHTLTGTRPPIFAQPNATVVENKPGRKWGERGGWLWLGLVVWVWIIIASLRGGADQWDNPRYRVILLGWQAMLVARAFLSLKQGRSRWLIRILGVEAVLLVVFTHWYMYRYMQVGFNIGIRNTLALAIGLSVLLVLGDLLIEKWRSKARP
jgi:4-amino-4-deoxy-L-arabinose transferase-like glycosyltransferase